MIEAIVANYELRAANLVHVEESLRGE